MKPADRFDAIQEHFGLVCLHLKVLQEVSPHWLRPTLRQWEKGMRVLMDKVEEAREAFDR